MIYLDTHVVAWLYAGELDLLPQPVRDLVESEELVVSPMVELELQYLFESGRAKQPGRVVADALVREIGLGSCGLESAQEVAAAWGQDWTHVPFDRLIVAQASARQLPLPARDQTTLGHCDEAIRID